MRELTALLRLAGPLAVMHVGFVALGVVDSAVLGRHSPEALAGVGIASSIFTTFIMMFSGFVLGMDTLVPQALGAGNDSLARGLLRRGLRLAAILSVPGTLMCAGIPLIMQAFGVDPLALESSYDYVWARLPGMLPMLLFAAQRSYLQAVGVTQPLVWALVLGNVINVFLDVLLVFGGLGIPAMGAVGAGIASTAVAIAIALVGYVGTRADVAKRATVSPGLTARILRLGVPVGLQVLAEFGLFTMAALLAGRLGKDAGAAHMIAIGLASTAYAFALGIAGATSVRVGRAVGRQDLVGVRRSARIGVATAVVVLGLAGLAFLTSARVLAGWFTSFPDVLRQAVPMILVAAAFQFSDAVQAVASGALRGIGDTRFSFVASAFGHYAVGLPVAFLMAFQWELGATGLWWGLTAGLTAVAVCLYARFEWRARRPIAVSL